METSMKPVWVFLCNITCHSDINYLLSTGINITFPNLSFTVTKVKVKVVLQRAMKAQKGSTGIAVPFL
jgi:hypothetical protein